MTWMYLLVPFLLVLYNDLKRKNYEHESYVYSLFLLLLAYFPILFYGKLHEGNNLLFYLFLVLILLIIVNVIPKFQKTQAYRYKIYDIDNKKLYINEIENIIKIYKDKSESINKKSQITLDEQKIIFKNMDKQSILECLSSIDKIIEIRRKSNYNFKNYIFMYLKKFLLPIITFSILLYLVHIFY